MKKYILLSCLMALTLITAAQFPVEFRNDLEREGLNGRVREINFRYSCDSVNFPGYFGMTMIPLADCNTYGTLRFNADGNIEYFSVANDSVMLSETRTYEGSGQISSAVKKRNEDTVLYVRYLYNTSGLPGEEVQTGSAMLPTRYVYEYDKRGRLSSVITYVNGMETHTRSYVYFRDDRVKREIEFFPEDNRRMVYRYKYTYEGYPLHFDLPSGYIDYTYDENGFLIRSFEAIDDWSAPVRTRLITYDSIGNAVSVVTVARGSHETQTYRLEYDRYGNLVRETGYREYPGQANELLEYFYSPDGLLLCYSNEQRYSGNTWITIYGQQSEYDRNGNWIRQESFSLGYIQVIVREIIYYP